MAGARVRTTRATIRRRRRVELDRDEPCADEPLTPRPHADDARAVAGRHVRAETVTISQGGANSVEAENVSITQGGAAQVRAAQLSISEGGVALARTENLTIGESGSAFAVVADSATVEEGGNVFMLIARSVGGDVRPVLDWRAALAFGAGLAVVGQDPSPPMTLRLRRPKGGIRTSLGKMVEGEERQSAVLTCAFIATIVAVVVILVGAIAVSWYNDNLRPLARVGTVEVRPQQLRDALVTWCVAHRPRSEAASRRPRSTARSARRRPQRA